MIIWDLSSSVLSTWAEREVTCFSSIWARLASTFSSTSFVKIVWTVLEVVRFWLFELLSRSFLIFAWRGGNCLLAWFASWTQEFCSFFAWHQSPIPWSEVKMAEFKEFKFPLTLGLYWLFGLRFAGLAELVPAATFDLLVDTALLRLDWEEFFWIPPLAEFAAECVVSSRTIGLENGYLLLCFLIKTLSLLFPEFFVGRKLQWTGGRGVHKSPALPSSFQNFQ